MVVNYYCCCCKEERESIWFGQLCCMTMNKSNTSIILFKQKERKSETENIKRIT